MAWRVASLGDRPCRDMIRSTFSTTTMASSTTIPMTSGLMMTGGTMAQKRIPLVRHHAETIPVESAPIQIIRAARFPGEDVLRVEITPRETIPAKTLPGSTKTGGTMIPPGLMKTGGRTNGKNMTTSWDAKMQTSIATTITTTAITICHNTGGRWTITADTCPNNYRD
jgi:hypothetical protein